MLASNNPGGGGRPGCQCLAARDTRRRVRFTVTRVPEAHPAEDCDSDPDSAVTARVVHCSLVPDPRRALQRFNSVHVPVPNHAIVKLSRSRGRHGVGPHRGTVQPVPRRPLIKVTEPAAAATVTDPPSSASESPGLSDVPNTGRARCR